MNDYSCPLCPDTYGQRTNLHVHLEVEHRKSEIVSHLVEALDSSASSVDGNRPTAGEEPPIQSA